MRQKTFFTIIAVGLLMMPGMSFAQEEPEVLPAPGVSTIPLNFAPPGARALGMGSTFIGIADDATAAESNPAGLTILTRPEVSAHVRNSSFDVEVVDLNAAFSLGLSEGFGGNATGSPVATFDESVTAPSFVSYVQPAGSWVFSLYYLQTANFDGSSAFAATDSTFFDLYSSSLAQDVLLENVGVSAAFRAGDMFSFGASVRYSSLDLEDVRSLQVDYFNDIEFQGFDPNTFVDSIRINETIDDDDDDITFNAGLLINPNGTFSFGAVYKEGGEYEVQRVTNALACVDFSAPLTCDTNSDFVNQISQTSTTTIEIPDLIGAGVAWRPTDTLLIALDAAHITYSDLDFAIADPFFAGVVADELEEIDDETEIHLGIEYTILAGNTPISFRGGAHTDPDHDGFRRVDSDQEHITAGIGFVFAQDFQLDIGASFSDTVDVILGSAVYRF